MYRIYVEDCRNNYKTNTKLATYQYILNTETNIGFHKPNKDQCGLCEKFKNANEETRAIIKDNFEQHIREKELSGIEKSRDIEDGEIQVNCFDLQAVLSQSGGAPPGGTWKNFRGGINKLKKTK